MAALKYPARLESNNPAAYGIVKAAEISGFKCVNTRDDLYTIPDSILSVSGNNTNNDALGQIWYVTSDNDYYKLVNFKDRNNANGWERMIPLSVNNNVNIGSHSSDNNVFIRLCNSNGYIDTNTLIPLATINAAGVMSKEDKAKLDSIQGNGGEDNVIESIKVNGTALPITDKSVNIPIETVDLSNYNVNEGIIQFTTKHNNGQSRIKLGNNEDNREITLATGYNLDSYIQTCAVISESSILLDAENVFIEGWSRKHLANFSDGSIIFSNVTGLEKIEINGGRFGNGLESIQITSQNLDFTNVKAFTGIKTINGQSILGTGNIQIDFSFVEIAQSLDSITNPQTNKIYLVSNDPSVSSDNLYTEYIYINGAFEKIGEVTSSIDLSSYYTKTETDSAIDTKIDTLKSNTKTINGNSVYGSGNIEINTDLSNYNGNVNIIKTSTDSYNNNLQSKLNFNNNSSTLLYKVSNDTDEFIASLAAHNNGISINTNDSDGELQLNMSIDTKEIMFDTSLNSFASSVIINPEYITIASNNLDLSQVQSITGLKTINGQSILGSGNISTSYTLPTASSTVLGGVKVGAGLSINNGVLSANGGGTADSVDWSNVQNKPTFSTVATSGSYNDLTDKPAAYTLPAATNESLGGVILGATTNSALGEFTINADSNNRIYTTINYAKNNTLPTQLGLITKQDYTNFLENYNWYKSITGDDTDTVINKYQEIVNFLDTYTEADTLANLLSNKADLTDVSDISQLMAQQEIENYDRENETKNQAILQTISDSVNSIFNITTNDIKKIVPIKVIQDYSTKAGYNIFKILFVAWISDQSGSCVYLKDVKVNNNIIYPTRYISYATPNMFTPTANENEANGVSLFELIVSANDTNIYNIVTTIE